MAKHTAVCCTAPNYGDTIIQAFQQLHDEDLFHDVMLLSEDYQSYQAHRPLLAASSDYFRAMFSVGMKESLEMEVHLQGVPSQGLSSILEFIYSGKLFLSMANLETVLSAAVHLQVNEAVRLCKEFMVSKISAEDSIRIYQLAQLFYFNDVEAMAFDCILENFRVAARQVDFYELSAEQVMQFLKRNDLKACKEIDLFEIAREWIDFDREVRLSFAGQLMRKIRLPLITPSDLETKVKTVDFMRDITKCSRLVEEAEDYHRYPFLQNKKQSSRTQVRGTEQAICVVGGMSEYPTSQVMAYKIEGGKEAVELKEMNTCMHVHCAAVMDGFLYCVGGYNLRSTSKNKILSKLHRYDPRFNHWMELAPMSTGRINFSLCVFEGKLYAIGGIISVSNSKSQRTGSVEVYTPDTNSWEPATPLMSQMSCHAAVVYHDEIYLSGGDVYTSGKPSNNMMTYNPLSGNIHQKSPMKVARYLHGMCVVCDRIYVIGGVNQASSTTRSDVTAIECYDPYSNYWQIVTQMPFSRSVISPIVVNEKICILGGFSSLKQRETSEIIEFDPCMEWHVAGNLLTPISGHTCSMLTLPNTIPNSDIDMKPCSMQTTV
ncbi:kelch-like protein 9 [Ptychodera flava]|uniref:kelch-like protein 9 n=1 Tax=Ptychodera flava TaxID=63121 RepID=UPI003969ED9D